MKGSEIRSAAEEAERKRAMLEFVQKIEHDPYQPGFPQTGLFPDEIAEIIEDLMYVRDFSEITIKINKEGETLKAEVISRNK
jgi:hypothetical protein